MTDKIIRNQKTPAQKAQEQVNILQRRLERIRKAQVKLSTALANIKVEETAVQARLTYAEASPDLPAKAPVAVAPFVQPVRRAPQKESTAK